jgi:hypothetical protein
MTQVQQDGYGVENLSSIFFNNTSLYTCFDRLQVYKLVFIFFDIIASNKLRV